MSKQSTQLKAQDSRAVKSESKAGKVVVKDDTKKGEYSSEGETKQFIEFCNVGLLEEIQETIKLGPLDFNGYIAKNDVQAGQAEYFINLLGDGKDWLRHSKGTMVPVGMIIGQNRFDSELLAYGIACVEHARVRSVNAESESGHYVTRRGSDKTVTVQFIGEKALRELAEKQNDLRRFKTIDRETKAETIHEGALIGNMAAKRQSLVCANAEGRVYATCLHTGRIAQNEKADRSVEIGALSDSEKKAIASRLQWGATVSKLKNHSRNAVKKARRLALGS